MNVVFLRSALALLVCIAGAGAGAAPVPDTIAQRASACTVCHGQQGVATRQGYFPRIAGKPAGYLYNQLVNFREGRRPYALMTYLVEHLTDDYLHELADYYAGLDMPYPPPERATLPAAQLARGQQLALQGDAEQRLPACSSCHGAALTGVQPALPGLLGLPRDYLTAQIGAWQTHQRRAAAPDCMGDIARRMRADDVAAVTSWLAAQPLPADTKPAAAPPAPLPARCGAVPQGAAP